MRIYHLRCELLVKEPISKVFAFFENAHNLSEITPPWLQFNVLTRGRIDMHPGTEIEYRIRLMGFPMNWKSRITEYQPPFEFVDEQIQGPYAYWHHRHTFRTIAEGTLVGDHVQYSLPFAALGAIAQPLMVRPQLTAIFKYRQAALAKQFSGKTVRLLEPIIALR